MMYPRLVLLRELLAEDGSIWVSIEDNEGHYLKVLMDEVFGQKNFVASIVFCVSPSSGVTGRSRPAKAGGGGTATSRGLPVQRSLISLNFTVLRFPA